MKGPFGRGVALADTFVEHAVRAYVRYRGQGIAHLPSGEDLGPVPGVVLIPVHDGEPRETTLVVWDESGVETAPLSLATCADDRVCLLNVLPAP